MKDTRQLLIRHQSITLGLMTLVVFFMSAPFFDSLRSAIVAPTGLASGILWLPAAFIAIGGSLLIAKSSIRRIALPLKELAKTVEHGQLGFAFQRKSSTREEDALKHYIESQGLRNKEAEDKIEELETELDTAEERATLYKTKKADLELQAQNLEKQIKTLKLENESLASSKVALEITLENERKSKVGVEVEKRSDEIYAQMERAVAAAAERSIWTPSLVQELKTPMAVINDLSTRLRDSWNETSLSRINREIEQICRQSESQLDLLARILTRDPEPAALISNHAEVSKPISLPSDPSKFPAPTSHSKLKIEAPLFAKAEPAPQAVELMDILRPLAEEFGSARAEVKVALLVESGLQAEIDDESLEPLLRCLLEIMSNRLADGAITLRVSRHNDYIAFDVECQGQPRLGSLPNLARAERLARALRSQVEVEMPNDRELRLSFSYGAANLRHIGALDV